MSFTLLSVAILGITALLIYGQVKKGYKLGIRKSFINLAVLLVSAFLGAWLSSWVASLFSEPFIELMIRSSIYNSIQKFMGDISIVAGFIITIVLSLVLYVPIFLLVRGVISFVVRRVSKRFIGYADADSQYVSENASFVAKNDKKIGGLIGAVAGFVLSVAIFMPLVGLMSSANDAIAITKEITNVRAIEESEDFNTLDRYANDFSVKLLYSCGGSTIYDVATRVEIDGETTYINKELKIIRNINFEGTKGLFKESFTVPDEKMQQIELMLEEIDQSVFLRYFSVQMIKNTSDRWLANKGYAGLRRPAVKDSKILNEYVDALLTDLSKTTVYTYDEDIMTTLRLINLLQDNSSLLNSSDYGSFSQELDKKMLLQKIDGEIAQNPRMSTVDTSIDKCILELVTIDIYNEEVHSADSRERLFLDLAEALNKTRGLVKGARESAMSSYSAESFKNFNMSVSSSVNARVANNLLSKLSRTSGDITWEEVEEFFDAYRDKTVIVEKPEEIVDPEAPEEIVDPEGPEIIEPEEPEDFDKNDNFHIYYGNVQAERITEDNEWVMQ